MRADPQFDDEILLRAGNARCCVSTHYRLHCFSRCIPPVPIGTPQLKHFEE